MDNNKHINTLKSTDGEFNSLKTRGVARGNMQKRKFLLTVATVAEHEKKNLATIDFPGAYLNSSRVGRAPSVLSQIK